jgi:hypothetical protein
MIFLNSNPNPQHVNQHRPSNAHLIQNQSPNGNQKLRTANKKREPRAATKTKILAAVGSLGLLVGIGLLVYGVIENINYTNQQLTAGGATIASLVCGSVLTLASLIALTAVTCILCNQKNQVNQNGKP